MFQPGNEHPGAMECTARGYWNTDTFIAPDLLRVEGSFKLHLRVRTAYREMYIAQYAVVVLRS